MSSAFRLGFRPEFDGLRGLACMLMLGEHTGFGRFGNAGVDAFFVLSGFLISSLLLEEWRDQGDIRLDQFFIRRAIRIIPVLYLFVFVLCVVSWVAMSPESLFGEYRYSAVASALLYYSNWFCIVTGNGDLRALTPTWSLAVEEHFYFFWPPILLVLLRKRARYSTIVFGLLAGTVVSLALRYWFHANGDTLRDHGSDARLYNLLLGCLISVLYYWNKLPAGPRLDRWASGLIAGAVVLTVIVSRLAPDHLASVLFVTGPLTTGLLIVVLTRPYAGPLGALMRVRPLQWLGRASYSVYLWNIPVFFLVDPRSSQERHGVPPTLTQLAIMTVLITIVGAASYHGVERQFLRLRRRFAMLPTAATARVV